MRDPLPCPIRVPYCSWCSQCVPSVISTVRGVPSVYPVCSLCSQRVPSKDFLKENSETLNIKWGTNSKKMKALKCKTLGASVMYIHCTLANIHVYTCIIFIIHSIIMHTRTNAWVYGEVYGNLAKTKALRSLLPTLSQSGTAWPIVGLLSSFRNVQPWKSERRFAAVPPYATSVSEY